MPQLVRGNHIEQSLNGEAPKRAGVDAWSKAICQRCEAQIGQI